jgi:hypothetical protein
VIPDLSQKYAKSIPVMALIMQKQPLHSCAEAVFILWLLAQTTTGYTGGIKNL